MAKTGSALLSAKARELGGQVRVAEATGVSQSLISRIINEGVQPTLDTAFSFQEALGIPLDAWRRRGRKRASGGPRRPTVPSPQSGGEEERQAS
jgi:transcriptional regulator with XRE-family HTH domain